MVIVATQDPMEKRNGDTLHQFVYVLKRCPKSKSTCREALQSRGLSGCKCCIAHILIVIHVIVQVRYRLAFTFQHPPQTS